MNQICRRIKKIISKTSEGEYNYRELSYV